VPECLTGKTRKSLNFYEAAEAHYRPDHVVRDEIVIFRAAAGAGADEAFVELYADPLLGWARRTAAGVRAFDVPGGHGSMLEEPQVAAVADRLDEVLGELDRAPAMAGLG
jgi:thioesterase domain-containing protein